MKVKFNAALLMDRHNVEFSILPNLIIAASNFTRYKTLSFAFLWLVWGVSVILTWEKKK